MNVINPMKDDKSRLENFLETMPKDVVEKITGQMFQRIIKHEMVVKWEAFKENFIRNPFSNFSDPEIKELQEKFYLDFKELDWFTLMNFKRSNSSKGYRLKSDVQKESKKWHELTILTKNFKEGYKKLISDASKKLLSNELKTSTTEQSHNVTKTEYQNYILYFCGKEIDFARKDNQRELLKTLFENKNKEWFYDEIQEKWDSDWDGAEKNNPESQNYWRRFYNAGNDINTAIRLETGTKDFIMKNTGTGGWIKINPKYV